MSEKPRHFINIKRHNYNERLAQPMTDKAFGSTLKASLKMHE